jgi:uncharacterized repeat protein (TIGR01451 family)
MAGPPEQTRFIVYLRQQKSLTQFNQQVFASQMAQRQAIFASLVESAQAAQAAVKSTLDSAMATNDVIGYQSFYIINALAVEGNLQTLIQLAQRDDIERIAANYPLVPADELSAQATAANPAIDAAGLSPNNWNITLVGADRVWSGLGVRGEGAVVADFDTGVSFRHPALVNSYRGNLHNGQFDHNYNWFEPDGNLYPNGNLGPSLSKSPNNCDTHGTHTMGTMVGDGGKPGTQIGMAPGAQWIAVPGICGGSMPGGIHDDIGALKAFQWLLCPTDLSGDLATADCSKAPDAVNNSWGSANAVNDVLRPAIQRLREMGIAPVFAAGNPTAGPGSIGTPANAPEAITVGATDSTDQVAYFSGRGPSFYEGEQKPELSAPGVEVLSSVYSSEYLHGSGTSMAAPHVTGLIALMVSADLRDGVRDFSVDELEHFMELTAVDLGEHGPDNDYGYGRINAYEAVRWVLSAGDLRGAVRDAVTNQPLALARIQGLQTGTAIDFNTRSGANGTYSTTVPAGAYQLTVGAWGYVTQTLDAQPVVANALSTVDVALQPLPTTTLQGVVRIDNTPMANALISVEGAPNVSTRTNADGAYNLTLPVGLQKLVVQAAGGRTQHNNLLVTTGQLQYDFNLARAPSILLVDADAYGGWFFSWSVLNIFRWALDKENYAYDVWRIQDPSVEGASPQPDGSTLAGIPPLETLRKYELVIWMHSGCDIGFFGCVYGGSPHNIGADTVLMHYLDQGGRLILSGQDIGAADNGTQFFDEYLQTSFLHDATVTDGDRLLGKDFLSNLQVKLTNASLYGYRNGFLYMTPDALAPAEDSSEAKPVLFYENTKEAAAVAVASCHVGYRALYLGMGYENIGPRADNRDPAIADVMDKSISWAVSAKADYDLNLVARQIEAEGHPGDRIAYTIHLANNGLKPATIQLTLANNRWPTHLYAGATLVNQPLQLAPCEARTLTVMVDVPANASNGSQSTTTLTAAFTGNEAAAQTIQVTTTAFGQWHIEGQTSELRYGLGAVTLPGNNLIYALGGRQFVLSSDGSTISSFVTDSLTRYDPCKKEWQPLASMPAARLYPGVAALKGKIYVVSGYGVNGEYDYPVKTVFVYDPAKNQWSQAADLPIYSAFGVTVAATNDKLYAFGGYNGSSFINDTLPTYEYNPDTNQWTEKASMPTNRENYRRATTLNGQIYVVGGLSYDDYVDRYDPATDTWTTLASLREGRYLFGLTTGNDGYIYAIGGNSGLATAISAERYSPATNQWEKLPNLIDNHRSGVAAVYAAGQIFALGGYGQYRGVEALPITSSFCLSTQKASSNVTSLGGSLFYTVTLKPDGVDLSAARFTSQLPAEATFGGFVGTPSGVTYDATHHQVQWQGALAAATDPREFAYRLDFHGDAQAVGKHFSNVATFDSGTGAVFTRENKAAILSADFSASSKQVDHALAVSGDTMTYTIQVRGRTMVGGNLSVQDPLPAGVDYLPDSLSYTNGSGHYDPSSRSILWQGAMPSSPFANITDGYIFGDSDGGGELPEVGYEWVDLHKTGKEIGSGYDFMACDLPIGFAFDFFGVKQTTFCVSSNGFISFVPNANNSYYSSCPLGTNSSDNDVNIAAAWTFLILQDQMRYQTFGVAPNRTLVVQWSGALALFSFSSRRAEFEVILHENGSIRFLVREAGSLADTRFTSGIKNTDNTQFVTYGCNRSNLVHDKFGVTFVPPGIGTREAATDIHFRVVNKAGLAANTTITNTAAFTTQAGLFQRSAATLINSVSLASSSIQVNKTEILPNEEAIYSLTLRNSGLMTASTASAVMPLPTALSYVDNSLFCSSGQCQVDAGTFHWTGLLPPHGVVTATITVRLVTPLADLTPLDTSVQLDDGFGNHYTLPFTLITRRSDLHFSFVQVNPNFVEPGKRATIAVFVRNTGRLPTTAQLQIAIPTGALLEESSLQCGVGVCTTSAGTINWSGTVAPRVLVPIRFQITAPDNAIYGEHYNGSVTLKDLDWGDTYTYPTSVWVAHGFYITTVMLPTRQLYLPMAFQN